MMEEEPLNNDIDVSAIKKTIEDNRSTLLSVIDANDLLLTELVGEEVLDESTQEEILSGSTRIAINKRLLNWLTGTDDMSTFKMFLAKLRKYGQSHVANLLDGTQGKNIIILLLGTQKLGSLKNFLFKINSGGCVLISK